MIQKIAISNDRYGAFSAFKAYIVLGILPANPSRSKSMPHGWVNLDIQQGDFGNNIRD